MSSAVNGITTMPPAGARCTASGCCMSARGVLARQRLRHARRASARPESPGRCATAMCASPKSSCQRCHVAKSRKASAPSSSTSGRRGAELGAQLGQRVERVAGPAAPRLAVVDGEARIARHRQPRHRHAVRGRRARRARDAAACRSARSAPRRASASAPSSSARRRWPKWIGSNVPPRMPMGPLPCVNRPRR